MVGNSRRQQATQIAEFCQSGGSISLILRNDARIDVAENLVLQNIAYESDHSLPLTTNHLEISGDAPIPIEATGDVISSSGSVASLTLTGSGTQTVSGTLRTGTLRLRGGRAAITGTVYVTDTLYGPSSTIIGGKNIIFSGHTIENGRWNGDLTVRTASLTDVRIAGTLQDNGGTSYAGSVTVDGALNCTGTSSIGNTSTMSVYGTAWFTHPMTGTGKLRLYSDLGTVDAVTLSQEVILCGSVPQEVSGAFTVGSIRFANTGQKGITVWDTVTVTGVLDNPTGVVDVKTPIYLGENGEITESFSGTVSVRNWTLHTASAFSGSLLIRDGGTVTGDSLRVKGTLTAEGAATLDGCAVTAGTLKSPSGLTLANGASVTVLGAAELGGTLTNPTEMVVYSDLHLSGLTASGAIRAKGDVAVSGATQLGALTLDGSFKQAISGSDFSVGDLGIYNTSGRPLTLAQTIRVTGRYDNPSTAVQGGAITGGLETAENVTADTVLNGDLTLSMPLTVTNCTLVVNGAVSVESVTLVNATLTVNGGLTLTGGTTAIDESSRMTVNGSLYSPSGTITLDGALDVRSDLILERTALTGGSLMLGGDLYGSGALTPQSLTLNGLTRQRIGAANLHTGDLTLANAAKGGILLEQKVCYSGAYQPGGTALFNSGNLVKEAA